MAKFCQAWVTARHRILFFFLNGITAILELAALLLYSEVYGAGRLDGVRIVSIPIFIDDSRTADYQLRRSCHPSRHRQQSLGYVFKRPLAAINCFVSAAPL